eukprot:TRINITY_DN8766_c0_g1_i1.p1 TRINITY_DN8766_c0_g1~~TRINITY_DN8766_c0_g1_i1.p1  ORF type:complete len:190 (+),score=29.16 TRINITY_DN8766_c0_g1_i1:209-778(+)
MQCSCAEFVEPVIATNAVDFVPSPTCGVIYLPEERILNSSEMPDSCFEKLTSFREGVVLLQSTPTSAVQVQVLQQRISLRWGFVCIPFLDDQDAARVLSALNKQPLTKAALRPLGGDVALIASAGALPGVRDKMVLSAFNTCGSLLGLCQAPVEQLSTATGLGRTPAGRLHEMVHASLPSLLAPAKPLS